MSKLSKTKTFSQWMRSYKGQKIITVAVFMLIPLALLLTFTYIPAINLTRYSVEIRNRYGNTVEFAGIDNFESIFTRGEYMIAFANTGFYLIGYFIQIILSLFIASILCSKIKFSNFFKGVLFFPYMMNIVAVALIFRLFFQKGNGINNAEGTLNSILILFGQEPSNWLSTKIVVNICLVFVSAWRNIGFFTIIFMAAIHSISKSVYGAAAIDGVNRRQRLWYIIIPNIRPIITLQILLAIRGAFGVFNLPYIITGGKYGSSTFIMKTIETAFIFDKIGLASAMAVVLLFIFVVITLVQESISKEDK